MINWQTKLRINHLTAVKSVAILEIIDYVEVRNPTTKAQLLQLVAKYKERHAGRGSQDPINNVGEQDWDLSRIPERRKDGNWRDAGVLNRQDDMRVTNRDSNGFRDRGDARNQRSENRIRDDRSDHRSDNYRG
ncbi:hypothetical protein TNCV_1689251 [Trichonephila clavipes]|nr:hypothetical protein TNCV_1689251 [Trichonephila clavipes]